MKRALLIAASVLALTPAAASGQAAVLGAAESVNASCPTTASSRRVTGFQTSIGNAKNPFVAPADGQIVSWSIKLGKPKKNDVKAFNDEFGLASARLSILKPVPGTSNPAIQAASPEPGPELGKIFGQISTFNLTTRSPSRPSQVVALTIPTWAPAFAVGQPSTTTWQASRRATKKRGGCTDDEGRANVNAGAPQVKKGKQQPYGCTYNSARLLYTATFVADGL